MAETRLLRGGVGVSRDHRFIPMFDFVRRMLGRILANPVQDRIVFFEPMDGFFECIAIKFKKTEEMFVEADGLVVITIEKPFAMQLRLVDQTREMNVAAEFLVRTARMQSSHGEKLCRVGGLPCSQRRF